MRIAFLMLNAFAKKDLGANYVRLTKDQQLQLQTRPELEWHCLVN